MQMRCLRTPKDKDPGVHPQPVAFLTTQNFQSAATVMLKLTSLFNTRKYFEFNLD